MPEKEQLQQALKVFEAWLREEAQAAELNVAASYSATSTTLPEIAEAVGVARGMAAVPALLRLRIDALP